MDYESAVAAAVAICESAEAPSCNITAIEAFREAGWHVCDFFGEAGREKIWEASAVTAYNDSLAPGYQRDMLWAFYTLYGNRDKRLPLYFIGGKTGNTVRCCLFPPGEMPENPFLYREW